MIYVGIDPGKSGAIAFFNPDTREVRVDPTPMVHSARARDEYDPAGIREMLRSWYDTKPSRLFVTVEKAQPIPSTRGDGKAMGGFMTNYQRGIARGGWEWMLVALEIPYQLVAPRSWQAVMHAGTPGSDTKQRSILAAQRLFPSVRLQRSDRATKPHDGIAEALLLAEYGRRTHQGLVSVGPDRLTSIHT